MESISSFSSDSQFLKTRMSNSLEESENIICETCNHHVINYPNQLCRRKSLSEKSKSSSFKTRLNIRMPSFMNSSSETSGNLELDEFIKETQQNSKACDDFVEWIPYSNLEDIKF